MSQTPTLQIRPTRRWRLTGLMDVWTHRSLLFHLFWRDLKSQHINSGLGRAWIVIQPVAMTAVLTMVLSLITRIPNQTLPHSLIVLSGLSIWTYFSVSVSRGASSLIANSYLLRKVYFPRLLFPLVPLMVCLVEAGVMLILLAGLSVYFGIAPTVKWFLIPIPIVLTLLLAFGFVLWLSALNVRFRDIGAALPITIQVLMYLSPVIYLPELVPTEWRELYQLNPICGPISLLRWIVFDTGPFPWPSLASTGIFGLLLGISGLLVFQTLEDEFADVV